MEVEFTIVMTKHGAELSVKNTETADQFDDYLTEKCGITTYLKPIDDGMIFGFGEMYTADQIQSLVEKFNQTST
ncbi:hypothetical protein OVA03_13365 [Asticcacaulis sp. SL142]|uniref:hypothetical protein n=1 Tax=Asticcacaulis sp. SL142 TaxID=2995155 RepID=UPI00226CCF6E|nr:hypothetical protein [Asticcacaulis sp. SL142]WAC47684.1 hypothetical protein OVA03_13365 [Asticcacaulis sp. SL142]